MSIHMNGLGEVFASAISGLGPVGAQPSSLKHKLIRESNLQASAAAIPPSECPKAPTLERSNRPEKGAISLEALLATVSLSNTKLRSPAKLF
jgi:hypothetical protein